MNRQGVDLSSGKVSKLLFSLALNLVVGLVNLLHLFLRQICKGIVMIVIGMVFPRKLSVCFLYIFV